MALCSLPGDIHSLLVDRYDLVTKLVLKNTNKFFCSLLKDQKIQVHPDLIAQFGYLEVLKWIIENGCLWYKDTCLVAAESGHLEVLKLARENNCPWNGYTKNLAKKNGRMIFKRFVKRRLN